MSSVRGKIKSNGSFDWTTAIIDASIMGGISFITILVGMRVAGLFADPQKVIIAAGLAAALGFLTTLALK